MREFVNIDMKEKNAHHKGERISIPSFMLSPSQAERKRKEEKLHDDVSSFVLMSGIAGFIVGFIAIDQNPAFSVTTMLIASAVFAVSKVWRVKHGYD